MKKYLLACSLCVATTLNGQELKIHTIGDSTMADYAENTTRTRGWGEMLQEFFHPKAQVINYARGGRSSRSFFEEGRWQTVKNNLSPGDYLFIQFAHNDAKEGGKDGADFRGTAPWTTYKRFLELYVDETRALQGNPILITPIVRRYFDKEGKITPKGCHDLGIAPDDSTLNYVRVMKQVARQKKVPLVDLTALTKEFVETLGQEKTTRQIYVSTDGTHPQATGAACYAQLVAQNLKEQGLLTPYIKEETNLVLNPTQLDFQTVYVGDKSFLGFDLIGLNLSPKQGTILVEAPTGMNLSETLEGTATNRLEVSYEDGKLWNKSYYLHYAAKQEETVNSAIKLIYGNQLRELPVKAIAKEIAHREAVEIKELQLLLKGVVTTEKGYTIESGHWAAEIDEDFNRYVEFIVKSNEKTVVVQQLSFVLKGAINYRIAYARGKDFYPRTDIGENKPGERVEFPINTTLKPGEQLHIRLFPWNTQSGALTFQIEDCLVKALEIE